MTSAFLTLTKGQGHTTTSKVIDVEVSAFSECFLFHLILKTNERRHKKVLFCFVACNQQICNSLWVFIIPPQNRGGVIFSMQFVCLSVFLCVRLCLWTKFQHKRNLSEIYLFTATCQSNYYRLFHLESSSIWWISRYYCG